MVKIIVSKVDFSLNNEQVLIKTSFRGDKISQMGKLQKNLEKLPQIYESFFDQVS